MTRNALTFCLLLCVASNTYAQKSKAGGASSVGGWSKARFGMTTAQVIAIFAGEAKKLDPPPPTKTINTSAVSRFPIQRLVLSSTLLFASCSREGKTAWNAFTLQRVLLSLLPMSTLECAPNTTNSPKC